ncbi:MAG: assimilatory sulfite reductase (NADPH) flavoprotein subunit [Methyloceanibacter sp.]
MSQLEPPGAELSAEHRALIEKLVQSLRPGQAAWVSGFFAGLERGARQGQRVELPFEGLAAKALSAALASAQTRTLTILFGSETGNCAALASATADAARAAGLSPNIADMAQYKTQKLKDEQDLLVITSTHGEGDPPQSAKPFFEFLESRKAPKLPSLRYAILALGDSTYEHYCGAGKWLDQRLAELGATALEAWVDCDVDYDETAAVWISRIITKFEPASSPGTPAAEVSSVASAAKGTAQTGIFDRRRPFLATLIDNFALTGRGSGKETRHIELSLSDSGISFQPGDALGIHPSNDPALINSILSTLGLSPDAPIVLKSKSATLGDVLARDLEISSATPRFLERWAVLSGSSELERLVKTDRSEDRVAFLHRHHVVDLVHRFPVKRVDPQAFVDGLRPLQPRLYSIASSQSAFPDEVHLTISTLRYELHDELRTGVTSGYFSQRATLDETVPIYVQPNPHFRLAADDVPILMIGAGTGVAPYRSFVQDREARGARGKSWLFFGERNHRWDFLYQTEWQDWLKSGALSRITVAFSRDREPKTYVQHRLKEQSRDVYAWLQEGAHLYICGTSSLAPEIHASLRDIIETEGGLGRAAADDYIATLQREHRYQVDVY